MTRGKTTRGKLYVFVMALAAAALAWGVASAADKTLYRKASPYTTVVVTENDQGLRTLRFGEDDARQSVVKPGDPDHVELEYARAMPCAMVLAEGPQRALIVGLGGGTIPGLLHKHYPRLAIDVVDIDPVVVEVAKTYFGFREDALLHAYVEDGRKFIERCKQPYDIIFLDAYGPNSIPYALATKEFLQAVRRATAPKGIVASNIWSPGNNPLHDAMVRTYQEVFDDLYVVKVTGAGNEILLAMPRKAKLDGDDFARRAAKLSEEQKLRFDIGQYVRRGFEPLSTKDPLARVLLDKDKPAE
jgi:spermidine synthase